MLYQYDSLEYRLIYYALCTLGLEWEKDEAAAEVQEVAQIHGVTVSEVHHALEALYTDNPDPDALRAEAEEG
ncbi:hypothetical protein QVE09_09600 [Paenibacillus sp. ClWae2A]|uniref:hypothetical protein n=1 Tax=Paenibacillus sp. ClWae2A TaxID=3057177 RepID=UPI0028F60149|nr:hypothetical protein [Paenibacillus sp. ClWae2A]MDT9719155.1 hypothetical protein [Paenibacillus sp. ClWae2A]